MDDCGQFVIGSRRHSICDGTAPIPEYKINAYRVAWGLHPLTEFPNIHREEAIHQGNAVLPKLNRPRPVLAQKGLGEYGPGTELLAIFKNAGVPSCQSCKNLARRMNDWGIEGCREKTEEIVNEILPRAMGWIATNMVWMDALTPGLVKEIGVKMKLRSYVEKSIKIAEQKPVPKKKPAPPKVKNNNKIILAGKVRSAATSLIPAPFTAKPKLNLICHCWPNGTSWKKHVDYLKPVQDVFDRKIMGVATGPGTSSIAEVQEAFGDSWEYIEFQNDKKLREVLTYREMLKMVESKDPNDVTFCIHTKGAQNHTNSNDQIKWWIEAMYATVIYNWREVLSKFEEGYNIAGSFRRTGSHFQTRYKWHYSGTFYAFRNAEAFKGGLPPYDERWWGTESWPGQHFSRDESACMFADHVGDVYKVNKQLESDLIEWKKHNGILRPQT